MKKPLLIFVLKCLVIIYFAACTSIEKLGVSNSVTQQLVTRGTWKVNCYDNANVDNTCIFEGYAFSFDAAGNVTASKKGITIKGNWLEDNISKKITLNFKNENPALSQLNDNWNIANINDTGITFENNSNQNSEKLYITAL